MVITVSSISFKELLQYCATRLASPRVLALVALLGAAGAALSAAPTPASVAACALLAGSLVVQFRVWDDLADVAFDRAHHPRRVLAASRNLRPYFLLVAGLSVLNAGAIAALRAPLQLTAYLLLLAAFALLYHRRVWPRGRRVLRNQLVLSKYPVFLYLGTYGAAPRALLGGALALYLLLTMFDLSSDKGLRARLTPRARLVIAAAAFALVLAALIWSR